MGYLLATLALMAPLILAAGCDDESPTSPSNATIVTFRVHDETFRVKLTTKEQVDAAKAARDGGSVNIPTGRIVAGADVNVGWSWHLEDVGFAEVTMELCDGRPSDVERGGVTFANGRFCPWAAQIVAIREPS